MPTIKRSGIPGATGKIHHHIEPFRIASAVYTQDAVRRASPPKEPWKLYDLGHGYCSYDFFDQCPHRMACARCDFYVPKESSKAQSIEAEANLLRLTQEIPLNEDEMRAVEDGIDGT